ncbi:MAG: hypothetical protein J6P44_02415 [Bacteroidales bacterium]|nr:hypothetical protein [Bacteroidales bacterium]
MADTALGTTIKNTAWGSLHLSIGATGTNDAMATTFDDLGLIAENGFSFANEAGEEKTLRDINGDLVDFLKRAGTIKINCTLLKPSESTRGKFWEMSKDSTSGEVSVKDTIKNTFFSIKIENKEATGSEGLKAAKCRIFAEAPEWDPDNGWTVPLEITILRAGKTTTDKGTLFVFYDVK